MRKSTIEPVGAIIDRPCDLKQIAIANGDLFIISCGNSTICNQIVDGRSLSAPTYSKEHFYKYAVFHPQSACSAASSPDKGSPGRYRASATNSNLTEDFQ